jgi:hypothetical protein
MKPQDSIDIELTPTESAELEALARKRHTTVRLLFLETIHAIMEMECRANDDNQDEADWWKNQ